MKLSKLLVIKFLTMTNLILIKSQDMDLNENNLNKEPLQSTYTYSSMDLKCLKDTVYHNSCYKLYQFKYVEESLTLRSIKRRR